MWAPTVKPQSGSAYTIVLLLTLAAAACVGADGPARNEVTVVHVPVLSACKDEVMESLRRIPSTSPFVGRYVPFDDTFRSHPDLVGFIVLESSEYSRETLVQLAGGHTVACFRLQSMAFEKSEGQEAARLFEFLNHASAEAVYFSDATGLERKVDPEQLYLVNEPEAIRVFFNLQ